MNPQTPPKFPLNGSLTIAEIVGEPSAAVSSRLGKQTIMDIGARYRQIAALKPGSSSKRAKKMIDGLIERLLTGESITFVTLHQHMPAISTLWYWCCKDEWLDSEIKWAQAMGQQLVKDLTLKIAAGGTFSAGV